MTKIYFLLVLIFLNDALLAQPVNVQYDYNGAGDCIFGASNNAKTPLFLHLHFTSIENTRFMEKMPYVKKLDPGYTGLFTLQREMDMDPPYFIFDIKTYRSNPVPEINLDFPYLVPFRPGTLVQPFDVENIDGFWGNETPKFWRATGFKTQPGELVYAARQGQIVEITGKSRTGDPKLWYHTWTNSITLLQPDGTLITYKNVIDKENKLQLNKIIHAGEILGEISQGSSELILLIYHNTLESPDLSFLIPLFLTSDGKTEILNSALSITVVHPDEIRGLEMTKKEQKQLLKKK